MIFARDSSRSHYHLCEVGLAQACSVSLLVLCLLTAQKAYGYSQESSAQRHGAVNLVTEYPYPLLSQAVKRNRRRPSVKPAYITVQTTKGAQVLVDGIYAGDANRRLEIKPGRRKIDVLHKDYHPLSKTIRFSQGSSQIMKVQLKKKPTEMDLLAFRRKKIQAETEKLKLAKAKQAEMLALEHEKTRLAQMRQALQQQQQLPPTGYQYSQQPMSAPPQYQMPQQAPSNWQQPPQKAQMNPKKPMKKKKRRRAQRLSQFRQPKPPPPRGSGDYLLSLLPLGLPQMRHDKPMLGFLFLTLQVGGAGLAGYQWFYNLPLWEADRAAAAAGKGDYARLTETQRKARLDTILNPGITQQYQLFLGGLGGAIAAYTFSVLEALVVGPKPKKTPLDLLLSSQLSCSDSPKNCFKTSSYRSYQDSFGEQLLKRSRFNLGLVYVDPYSLKVVSGIKLDLSYSL
ncbi:MAG: PEGA domain-containing protein [Proteobacteria bacterium]|nr:PEGA domain-containing protein [Pseudomonadota bacterium]